MYLQKFLKPIQLATLTALCLTFGSVMAADDGPFFGKHAPGKWIIGAKAVNIDLNDSNIEDSTGVGIVLGYEFDKTILGGRGKSSFEIEYITGDEENFSFGGVNGTYEADIINAFFNYRSAGQVYFKLKGGLSFVDIDSQIDGQLFDDFEDVSLAIGGGIGLRVSDAGRIELEYTLDSADANVGQLSLNGLLSF